MTTRWLLALVYVVGAGLTVVNGFLAFRSTERRLRRSAGRLVHSDRYEKEREGGAAEITRHGRSRGGGSTGSTGSGGTSDGSSGGGQLTAHELAQHLVDSFYENRVALALAGLGLLLTTAASIVSLFVGTDG